MNFGQALEHLKQGGRVRSRGWANANAYLYLDSFMEAESQISKVEFALASATVSARPVMLDTSEILADDWEFYMPETAKGLTDTNPENIFLKAWETYIRRVHTSEQRYTIIRNPLMVDQSFVDSLSTKLEKHIVKGGIHSV